MKRLSAILFLSIMLSVCVAVPSSMALGLGFYWTSAWGEATYDAEDDNNNTWDWDSEIERRGYGLVLDTAVAKDSVVNLRLNVGYYNWQEEDQNERIIDLDGFQGVFDLGFGIVRNQYLRFWVGAELSAAYGDGSVEGFDAFEVYLINVGVGPVAGCNFHFGDRLSLGIKAGYLAEGFIGQGENTITDTTVDYTGYTGQYFVVVSAFYRFNDVFK